MTSTTDLPRPGFLMRMLLRWTAKRQSAELDKWLGAMATLSDDQLGALAERVAALQPALAARGIDTARPFEAQVFGAASLHVARMSEVFNKAGQPLDAAAATVWGHTFRASADPQLLPRAVGMWRMLERGAPYCRGAIPVPPPGFRAEQ